MEISNLSDKKFKVVVIKLLTKLGRRMMKTVRISTKRKFKTEPISDKGYDI